MKKVIALLTALGGGAKRWDDSLPRLQAGQLILFSFVQGG